MLDLNLIRTDGGTQSRVALSEDTYLDYAEAMLAGATFPPVVVFQDGAAYWLADGFHRFFAVQEAGLHEIDADVRQGTRRDAILYSLKANGTHGIRRSNADKRKAVETLLLDDEWSKWSDRKVADACGVGAPLVADVRRAICNPITDAPATRTVERGGKVYQQDTSRIGKRSPATPPAPAAAPAPAPKKEVEDTEYYGPSDAEIAAAEEAAANDMTLLHKLIDTDDKLTAVIDENKQLRAELSVVKLSRDGYMNRSNELIARVKTLRKKLERAEASHA